MKNIVLARVDDRLIHTEILTLWVPEVRANRIIIGGMGIRGERKAVARRVACDAMEMEAIHELIKKHVHVYFQTVPTRSSEEAKKYIKE